jgi:hypothetical protein
MRCAATCFTSPPRSADAKPIALLMAELGIQFGVAWREDYILVALRRFAEEVPEVANIITALPPSPERVAKDRHCALPGCEMVGTGLHSNMKKCSRCRAVYYCCRQHQEDHWSEHKASCVKAAPVENEER